MLLNGVLEHWRLWRGVGLDQSRAMKPFMRLGRLLERIKRARLLEGST